MKSKMILFSFQKFLSADSPDPGHAFMDWASKYFPGISVLQVVAQTELVNSLIWMSFPEIGFCHVQKIGLVHALGIRPWTGSRFLKFSCSGPVGSSPRTRIEPLGLGPTNSGPWIPDWYAF